MTTLSSGSGLRGLLAIVPPGLRDAAGVARFLGRSAEHVPECQPVRALVPMRHPVATAADDPIEHLAGRDQLRPAVGRDDLLDQSIDRRIRDTRQVRRSLRGGRLGREIGAQQGAGQGRETDPLHGDVEVEIVDTCAKLRRVDDAQIGVYAERAQVLDELRMMRLDRWIIEQEFNTDPFAARRNALAIHDREARFLQESARLLEKSAVLARPIGHRREVGVTEHLVRDLAPKRLEQRQLVRPGFADGHHVGVFEERLYPLIGPIHDALVGPLEVECAIEGFAHPLVLEHLLAHVQEPTLHSDGASEGCFIAFDATVADRGKVVTRGPHPGDQFLAEKILLRREPLEREVAIAVELIADRVEVILAARDRQIGAPPILHAVELDEAAGLELPDLVRTGPKRHVERRLVERTTGVIGLRKNWHGGEEQRRVTRPVRRKAH